jgi:hypothetical protein
VVFLGGFLWVGVLMPTLVCLDPDVDSQYGS